MESKDTMRNGNTDIKNINSTEELSFAYAITFKILLIIQMIIFIFMLLLFGLNHLILFVISITVAIRMFIGINNQRPNYFIKSLFLFIMSFICHVIKIIFRFILTYFIYKNKENISDLRDMNIIETNNILWIKGFDIKLNGLWSMIILILFMIYWIILIILFEIKKKCFNYIDEKETEVYTSLINQYYQRQLNNENIQISPTQPNNNNIINVNNNFNENS